MSDLITISEKLYQRGQTGYECLACWQSKRDDLLLALERRSPLAQKIPAGYRYMVWFNPDVISSELCLFLKLFEGMDCVRYFNKHVFFAPLYTAFGRHDPAVLALGKDNQLIGLPFSLQADDETVWQQQLEGYFQSLP